jgi:glycerol uptake facilitator-like aquaporin
VLAYGICVSLYIHPIEKKIPNPTQDFLIAAFFYFAVSISAPFSGAHLNPAVTIAINMINKNKWIKQYFMGQLFGAFVGAAIGTL